MAATCRPAPAAPSVRVACRALAPPRRWQAPRPAGWQLPLDSASQPPPLHHQQHHQQQHQQPRTTTRATKGAAEPALPPAYQQTLRRSFVLGGVGLHTGEYAHVRVRPAHAGEGRYFVRVPPGTISPLWEVERPTQQPLEELHPEGRPVTDADSRWRAKLFFSFVESQERGSFEGSFAEFLQQRAGAPADSLLVDADRELLPEEQPVAAQPGEPRLPAHVNTLQRGHRCCSVLGQGDGAIWGAEHLLAALECYGVDNARIEVEGGKEIPIVDGSALGWASEIQLAGLRPAPSASTAEDGAARDVAAPSQVVTARDGESFITFFPGPVARITVGVDSSAEAPVIGRQWFTWSPEEAASGQADHFYRALAPARTCFASIQAVQGLLEEGLLQGGPDYVSVIADGDDWVDATMVRFPSDESARHAAVDLLGDLSLLASPGNRGMPAGHVVAYRPTHALQAEFVHALQASLQGL